MTDSMLRRLKRRLRGPAPAAGPPAWQRIQSGPLTGLELFLPTDPRPTSWVARILRGDYERRLLGELADLAQHGGVLYDVGGHVAFFACGWLRLGGERVEIFEPMPDSADRIEATLTRNHLAPDTRVHRYALGDFNGGGTFVQNATDIGLASMSHLEGIGGVAKIRRQKSNTRVSVEVRRLDDLADALALPPPVVVKIDVEGAEGGVVDGAASLFGDSGPVIFCEMHAIEPAVQAAARLTALGYAAKPLEAGVGMPVYRFDPPRSRLE